jgi:hypothetical protein
MTDKPEYEWSESPRDKAVVGSLGACTITKLRIDSIGARDYGFYAEGSFTFMDHIENFGGDNSWCATSYKVGDSVRWHIRPHDNGEDFHLFREQDGTPGFTASHDINADIRAFISGKLNQLVKEQRMRPIGVAPRNMGHRKGKS